MPKHNKKLVAFTLLLAFCVVVFGAYVRLSDAGLGCPDWPGCYGYFGPPTSVNELSDAGELFPNLPVDAKKAWTEMVHRYLATTLGFLIFILFCLGIKNRSAEQQQNTVDNLTMLVTFLLFLVVFQGLLGMWTVTLKVHPIIVLAHLVGGMSTLALLFYFYKILTPSNLPVVKTKKISVALLLGFFLLIIQIMLGGWTSSNYAALGCPDLPFCYGQLWPDNMDFSAAFWNWQSFGINYEGGLLPPPAKTAIHFTHRIGAVITLLVLSALVAQYLRNSSRNIRAAAWYFLTALITQFVLGIIMVWSSINIVLATMHNGFAALLLLSFINLLYALKHR
jgi:cytochrome c oxidase assembly protein subunit 15